MQRPEPAALQALAEPLLSLPESAEPRLEIRARWFLSERLEMEQPTEPAALRAKPAASEKVQVPVVPLVLLVASVVQPEPEARPR